MGGIGWTEILVVFCLILLLFGSKRIPELARTLGLAKREFHKAKDEILKERDELLSDTPLEKTKKKAPAKKKRSSAPKADA